MVGRDKTPKSKRFNTIAHDGESYAHSEVEAYTPRDARASLRGSGLVPVDLAEHVEPIDIMGSLKKLIEPSDAEKRERRPRQKIAPRGTFFFKAIPSAGGDMIQGDIMSADIKSARTMLKERGLTPISIEIKRPWHGFSVGKSKGLKMQLGGADKKRKSGLSAILEIFIPQQIPLKDLVFYVQQLSTMLDAGLTIAQTLTILDNSITHATLLGINADVRERIYEGTSLGEAYGKYEINLPSIFIELVAVGEASGNLEETMKQLNAYLERQMETMAKIKSALTYPIILLVMIVFIVIGLMLFVVPNFMELFKEFKVTLPWTTQTLLAASAFVQTKWWLLPVYPIGFFFAWRWIISTRVGCYLFDLVEFKIPLIGKLRYQVTVARILHNLALLLRCGVTILSALQQCRQGAQNQFVAAKMEGVQNAVSQGVRMAAAFEASGLFPPFVNHMLLAGEESGSIDELMGKGARYVDTEIDRAVKGLTAALEPIMTLLVAGIVLFVLGSLYMPMMGLMGKGG